MSILLCLSNALENRCKNVGLEALTTVGDGIVVERGPNSIICNAIEKDTHHSDV